MKKFLLLAFASVALLPVSALAADMGAPAYKAPPPPPPPVMTWTGCYVDGGVGYGLWNQDDYDETFPTLTAFGTTVTSGGRGWLGRIGGGCDYQFTTGGFGDWVVGAFGNYDFMDLKGSFGTSVLDFSGDEKESGAWYVGGRIGYLVTPSLLTYFSGGYTQTRFDQVNLFVASNPNASVGLFVPATTFHGWFLGGGTEYALNWSWLPIRGLFLRTDYRYGSYDAIDNQFLTTATGAPSGIGEHSQKFVQTITSELVWKFNWTGQ
jgi:outer membrane immunogenic protein